METDLAALDLVHELFFAEALGVVAAARHAPQERQAAGLAEGGAEVADDVLQLGAAALARRGEDDVVRVLQVPVVDEAHQDDEAVKLARPRERVLLPLPLVEALDAFGPRLEADVAEAAALAPLVVFAGRGAPSMRTQGAR